MKKKQLKNDYPDLYKWIYGPEKEKKSIFSKIDVTKIFKYFVHEINSILNTINYNRLIKKAEKLYNKTKIHRFVMPFTKTRCGIITGADLVSYNKRALKHGMKRFKYNTLKKESYFSTDNLDLAKDHKVKIQLIPIINN